MMSVYLSESVAEDQPDAARDAALLYARDEGASDGKAAASWYFDGNTDESVYTQVLRGLDDGDPAVLDTLPSPDLSGQWADSRTGVTLVTDALRAAGLRAEPTVEFEGLFSDICEAYEAAFSEAVETEVRRVAEYHAIIEPDPDPEYEDPDEPDEPHE